MNNYLTTNDLCLRFGCSQQTIWRMIKDGRLIPPTFPGRHFARPLMSMRPVLRQRR